MHMNNVPPSLDHSEVDLGNAASMSLVYYLITLTGCWIFFTIMTQLERRRNV